MTTSPFGRNRAEQFDDLLEGRIDDAPEDLTRLLDFAESVWALPAPEPRAAFTASLRDRLMAEAPAAMAEGATDHRLSLTPVISAGSARRRRRLAAVVAVASIGAAATGTAFAADGSLPGETLYPVKRLVESAHTAISFGDAAKGNTTISQARTRLAEATALAKAGQTERAADTLDDFIAEATQGADLLTSAGEGDSIHDFTTSSVTGLDTLSTLLPGTVLAPVVQTLVALDHAATEAFPDAGAGITSLPNTLVQLLSAALAPTTASGGGAPTKVDALSPAPSVGAKPGSGTSAAPTRQAAPLRSTPSAKPSKVAPSTVGEAVDGIGDAVGNGVVGGLGGALSSTGATVGGPVGGLVTGVGDAVTGVGGAVSDLLGGVGSLLTPPTSTPK